VVVGRAARGVRISEVCIGRVQDMGVTDMNNMGSAMAPAAADTLARFFADTETKPDEYDVIVTGDLGLVGARLCRELLVQKGYTLGDNYTDCGLLLFDRDTQDVHAGGSGCGCSASVLCAHWLPMLCRGEIHRLLFCPTGALMSPTSSQQGESIPGICHALLLETNS
jgi:stage V sporulation protein AD